MRRQCLFMLLGAVAAAAPQMLIAQQFEGVIKQRSIAVSLGALVERGFDVSEALLDVPFERLWALRDELVPEDNMIVTEGEMYIKGGLMRADASGEEEEGYVIVDTEQGVMRMVQPSQQMYMEMTPADLEKMRAMGGAMMGPEGPSEQPEPRATGLTRTINGMRCTAYDVETDEKMTRVWVSKDHADVASSFAQFAERMAAMAMMDDEDTDASMLLAKYGFPVLVQELPHEVSQMYQIEEVVSIERQSVSDDMFTPPAGFRKMTMADMMRRP